MTVLSGWMQQQQSEMGFDVLSSMVTELVALFEVRCRESEGSGNDTWADQSPDWNPDWLSPSSRTRIIRYGSRASLHSVLNQTPDTITAEYDVLFRGALVFNWCDYQWPQLQKLGNSNRSGIVSIPTGCLDELMAFHLHHNTPWLHRYNSTLRRDSFIEIDKISIVAQTDYIELG